MRLLIAIKSCAHDANRGDHNVIRNTWGKDIREADLRFFMGGDTSYLGLMDDEVMVDAPDNYRGLPYKTREILRWSITKNYDQTFLADTDTFIIPVKLITCGFEKHDYFGRNTWPFGSTRYYEAPGRNGDFWKSSDCYPWMSGGCGYFLSKKAAEIIAVREPNCWAEDLWVGQVLGPFYNNREIKMANMDSGITWHFPQNDYRSQYDPKFGWMEKMYKDFQ